MSYFRTVEAMEAITSEAILNSSWWPVMGCVCEEKHAETGGGAEMPLRFEFDAARLWLGTSSR